MCNILDELEPMVESDYSSLLDDPEVNYPCVFSCISQNEVNKLEEKINHIIESTPIDVSYKIFQKKEFKDFVIIGFSSDFFDTTPSIIRRLLHNLCNNLNATSCSITIKNNNVWDTVFFLRDELSHDNWKENSTFKEFLTDYIDGNKIYHDTNFKFDFNLLKFESIYHNGSLLMRNVDSEKVISDAEIDYITNLIEKGKDGISKYSFPLPYDTIYRMMSYPECYPSIPIILKKFTKSYEELWKGIEGDVRSYIPKGLVLGYYTRQSEDFCEGPHIVISPENVESSANNTNIPFCVLFGKVLIHEIAHAIMDKYRELHEGVLLFDSLSDNWPNTIEAKAMEESLANMITLNWFRCYATHDDYKYVEHYINNWQSSIYRFGIWQKEIGAEWEKWYNSSKVSAANLLDWFNRCFSSGNIKIPIEDYNNGLFDKVFE